MTIKEKLKADMMDPKRAEKIAGEIVRAICPSDLDYMEDPRGCDVSDGCVECWNREMPETKNTLLGVYTEASSNLNPRPYMCEDSDGNWYINCTPDMPKVEKALETKKEEKEKTMTGCKETQCTSCVHREVCALKADFLEASDQVANFVYTQPISGENVRLADIPFIRHVELQCKYYQVIINTRDVSFDVTSLTTGGKPGVNYCATEAKG